LFIKHKNMKKIIRVFKSMKKYELYSGTASFFLFSILTATMTENQTINSYFYLLVLSSLISTVLLGLFKTEVITRFKK